MKIRRRLMIAGAAALALTASVLVGGGTAYAANPPAWEPDTAAIGTINFYDASGNVITGGSLDDHPMAAYAAATGLGRAGDSLAQLKAFTPQPGVLPGLWSGDTMGGATNYPVTAAAAPANIKALTLPVASQTNTDFSLNDYIGEFPNTSAATGFQNLYELRLYTSGPGQGQGLTYYRVDILVNPTADTWSIAYNAAPVNSFMTESVSPATQAEVGAPVTVTATITPTGVPGTVEFSDGVNDLGAGSYNAATGKATFTTSSLALGPHKLNAVLTPTDTTAFTGSNAQVLYTIVPAKTPTSTTLSASPVSPVNGDAAGNASVTLTANVAATGLAGGVEFFDGVTDLGPADSYTVATGVATKVVTLNAAGSPHQLVATFTPQSSTFDPSTSNIVSFTVIPANFGTNAITLNAADNTAPFAGSLSLSVLASSETVTLTQVDPNTAAGHPVDVSVPGGHHHAYVFDGTLTGVSVLDTRPAESGWTVTGQSTNFINGGTTIPAANLGWTPMHDTPAGDAEGTIGLGAIVGSVLASLGSTGLSAVSTLATAGAGNGLGTANVAAGLDFRIPDTSPEGTYSGTLTLTLISP